MRSFSLLALVLVAGCQSGIYFSDDEGGPFASGSLFQSHADDLSLPYALGTRIALSVHQAPKDLAGWMLVSDTPTVFSVDNQMLDASGNLSATGHALADGSARVRLLDGSGTERHATAVEVRAADTAKFYAHGDLRVLGGAASTMYSEAELADARVLAGGKAVIAVGYFHASERVYGHGLVTAPAIAQLAVDNETSSGLPINEWLFIDAAAPGTFALPITQNGVTLGTLPVTAVADSDVTGLSIAAEPSAGKSDGDKTWLQARASGSDGREVLGVYCDWTLDGAAQTDDNGKPKSGDLYRYRFAKGGPMRTVVATHHGVSANIAVPAKDGFVNDTTYLGCSAAPGSSSPSRDGGWLAFFVVLALAGARSLRRAAVAP